MEISPRPQIKTIQIANRREFLTGGATAAAGAAEAVAMPNVASAQDTIIIKMHGAWGSGIFREFSLDYVKRVNQMLGGVLRIDYLDVDAVVKTAETLPFVYPIGEKFDLSQTTVHHYPDPNGGITDWVRRFLSVRGKSHIMDVIGAMTEAIRQDFRYQARDDPGVQTPM